MKKVLIILLIISVNKSVSGQSKYISRERFKQLGDSCTLANNKRPGKCKFVKDCSGHFKNTTHITICGFDRKDSIICCPQTENKPKITQYKKFTPECFVQGTNENGFLKLIKHCPRIEEEIRNGAPFPTVCNYEICKDLVCCPVGGLKRKNEVCHQFDDVNYTIRNRIFHEEYCTANGKPGVYKGKYQCNKSSTEINQTLCDYDFCEDAVCCPFSDIKAYTFSYDKTRFLNIIGGSCVDKITGEDGTCKTAVQCNEDRIVNYTSCGFEFCTELICCPNKRLKTSKSLQGSIYFR